MRVLITNFRLANRTGSELYVWDVATGLLDRGHTPIVYSADLGALALELSYLTVPVVDDLSKLSTAPDIIHGQNNLEIMAALLRFPNVPAVRFCHGWYEERPVQFPRILRYVVVDETTQDRALFEWGIPENRVQTMLNFADLDRFKPRDPLPARPKRAVVFSNYANEYLWAVNQACARMGISVDAIGDSVGTESAKPEEVLGRYDIVFAKGRCAIEALASGTAVVLCDFTGVGPMVTTVELERLRRLNFGLRTLRQPLNAETIAREVGRYDSQDASQVSRQIRSTAGRDIAMERIIELYQGVIAEYHRQTPGDPHDELRLAAAYIQSLAPRLRHQGAKAAIGMLLRDVYARRRRIPVLRSVSRFPAFIWLAHHLKRIFRVQRA